MNNWHSWQIILVVVAVADAVFERVFMLCGCCCCCTISSTFFVCLFVDWFLLLLVCGCSQKKRIWCVKMTKIKEPETNSFLYEWENMKFFFFEHFDLADPSGNQCCRFSLVMCPGLVGWLVSDVCVCVFVFIDVMWMKIKLNYMKKKVIQNKTTTKKFGEFCLTIDSNGSVTDLNTLVP